MAADPFVALKRLGPSSSLLGMVPWLALALLSHTGAIASPGMTMMAMRQHVRTMRAELHDYFAVMADIDIEADGSTPRAAAASEPQPESEPETATKVQPPEKRQPTADEKPEAKPLQDDYGEARPAAAEAADVLHQGETETEDLSANTIVHKDGSRSTGGGYTSSAGTAKQAEHDSHASANGKEGAHGNGDSHGDAAAKRVDRSRPALPIDRSLHDCPFPAQADMAQVDEAVVEVTVAVDPRGRATRANVHVDPGYGFGGQARRCALAMRYQPALSPDGDAVAGSTPTLRFRFNR